MNEPEDLIERSFPTELPAHDPSGVTAILLRPKAGETIEVEITSDFATLARSHFYAKNSFFCLHDPKRPETLQDCPFCKRGAMPRTRGFLCCVRRTSLLRCVLEVTEKAMVNCAIIRERKESVRGKLAHLSRPGKSSKGPVILTITQSFRSTVLEKLPKAFDIKEFLRFIWLVPTPDTLPNLFTTDQST